MNGIFLPELDSDIKILQHMQQQSKHLNKRFRLILIRTGWSSIWLSLSVSLAVQSHTHKAACSKALHYLSLCNSLKTIALIQLATERQCELLLFWENSMNHRCVFLSLYFYTCIRIWPFEICFSCAAIPSKMTTLQSLFVRLWLSDCQKWLFKAIRMV